MQEMRINFGLWCLQNSTRENVLTATISFPRVVKFKCICSQDTKVFNRPRKKRQKRKNVGRDGFTLSADCNEAIF